MDRIIAHPENKHQLIALKEALIKLNISFEYYPEKIIDGVKEAIAQADRGELINYTGIKNMLDIE